MSRCTPLTTGHFCSVNLYKLHLKSPCGSIMAMSAGSTTSEYSMSTVMAAVPVRREEMCLQFFWLLVFLCSLFSGMPPVPPARWMGSFMMTGTTSVPLWDGPSRASSQDQHIVAAGVQYNCVGRERRGKAGRQVSPHVRWKPYSPLRKFSMQHESLSQRVGKKKRTDTD